VRTTAQKDAPLSLNLGTLGQNSGVRL